MPALTSPTSSPAGPRPLAGQTTEEIRILIVDDSLVDRRLASRLVEKHPGWKAVLATNGLEALAILEQNPPRLVLTDLQMPGMDGLALVQQVRQKYPHIPVVLMTASGSEDLASLALQTGASSYVPKMSLSSNLESSLKQVLAASQLAVERRHTLACLTQRDSRFSLENDATLAASLAALLQEDLLALQLCDTTGATRVGIALEEALLNAMYHGNLEVSSRLREQDDQTFQRLVEQRRQLAPYRDRRVRLFANVTRTEAGYVILDQGPGFDPSVLPKPTDPTNLGKPTGRGVPLMRAFMDRITYSRTGNQVTLIKHRETPDAGRP